MGRRGAWLLVSLPLAFVARCSTNTPAPTTDDVYTPPLRDRDVGSPQIQAPKIVTVVRGESTTVPVTIPFMMTGALSTLPAGVTGSFGATSLTLTADANAPIAKASVTINATSNDGAAIATNMTVYVTGVDGSLDPAFGNVFLGSADAVVGLCVLADGHVVVATSSAVSRLTQTGLDDNSFGTSGRTPVPGASSIDCASDGHIAVGGGFGVVVLGADGSVQRTLAHDGGASGRVMWSGTNLVLVTDTSISVIDPNDQVTSGPLPPPGFYGVYPALGGRFALAGIAPNPDDGALATRVSLVAPSQGWYALDNAFGGGTVEFVGEYSNPTSIVATSTGALLVQVSGNYASDVVRLLADGTFDTTWGVQGYANVIQTPGQMVATASNRLLTTGLTDDGYLAIERFLADGSSDQSFGFEGRALTAVFAAPYTTPLAPQAVAVDALETVLYVGGNGWLLRYRIHA